MTKIFSKNKKTAPLRMKLFWYLAAFFLFAVALLWVFQVVFMDSFYRTVTTAQMKKDAKILEGVIARGGDIDDAAYEVSIDSGVCVSVYRIKDGAGEIVAEAHVKNGCFIHGLASNDMLNKVYNDTVDKGGRLSAELFDERHHGEAGSILYSVIRERGGEEYLMLFNTEAFPVGSTSATVTVQLTMITVILMIGAAILAVVMSRKITRPVSELSCEAEELAVGDYKVTFTETGIEELDRLGRTLNYAATELERSAKMKQELVANITHDLRTPLTMISGYSELMRDIPGEVTPENLQVIIDESARLSALVNDVLEVSKAENGRISLNRTVFCITDEVKRATERYGEMLRGKGYTVEYESDCAGIETYGDATKLMQAFCNLLNNAVNFTGESKRVVVRQSVSDGMCRTEVTDYGEGIPADELESVWDRYYRARDRHNKGVPGSGLGLSIVKHVMLLHDISFGVTSVPGEGSTFWFEVKVD